VAKLGHGWRTSHLELALLLVNVTATAGLPVLVSRIAGDTHVGKCLFHGKPSKWLSKMQQGTLSQNLRQTLKNISTRFTGDTAIKARNTRFIGDTAITTIPETRTMEYDGSQLGGYAPSDLLSDDVSSKGGNESTIMVEI